MRNTRILGAAAAAAILLSTAPLGAQTLGGVTFHGFVSQGYLNSTDNNWLSARTSEGSFAFTEAALNFNVEPVSRLRIGAQFYARDLGAQGNNNLVLDWAVGDYRFNDWLGFRAGKVKQPIALYNIVIDNPVARPEIIMPAGIYPLSTRDLTNTVQGFDLYGTADLGGMGELDYEGWVGTIDLDESHLIERFVTEGTLATLPALGLEQGDAIVADLRADMNYLVGGALDWRLPLRGLRLKLSGSQSESDVTYATQYSGFQGPIPVSLTARNQVSYKQDYVVIASAEYTRGGLRLASEYHTAKNEISLEVSGLPFPLPAVNQTEEPESWYAQAAYRFNDTWELSGYYSRLYLDKNDKEGLRFVLQGQPAYRSWLKQWTFSGRADINRYWLIKAEVSFMDGAAGLSLVDNPDGFVQDWTLFAFQTVVHF